MTRNPKMKLLFVVFSVFVGNEVKKGRSNSTPSLRLGKFRTKLQQQKRCFSPIKSLPVKISKRASTPRRLPRSGFLCGRRFPFLPARCPVPGGRAPAAQQPGPHRRRERLRDNAELGMLGMLGQRLLSAQLAHALKGSPLRLHRRQEVACKGRIFSTVHRELNLYEQ